MSPTFDAFLRSWPSRSLARALAPAPRWHLLRGWRNSTAATPTAGTPADSPLPRRARRHLSRARLADRAVRVAAAAGPHGAAPAADDGRPAADLARLAAVSDGARPARADSHLLDRAAAPLAPSATYSSRSHASARRAGRSYVAATWLWHTPRGLRARPQRTTAGTSSSTPAFIAAALLFWYPVVRPYPSRPRWSQWLLFPYLLLADVQNTVLAAWLTFSPRVLYPHYEQVPRLDGISALDDQHAAGVLMWVPGSVAFLLPLFWIGVDLSVSARTARSARHARASPPTAYSRLERDHTLRPALRLPAASAASSAGDTPAASCKSPCWRSPPLVIFDGLRGPQVAPMNLAGVLPWIHWRGLLILGLLVAGNFFCMACPFTLPRSLARRWLPAGRPWPRVAAQQVARRRARRALPLELRSVRPLGQPLAHGLDRRRLLRRRVRRRQRLPRRGVLQIRLPHRPVQLRAVARLAAGGHRPRARASAPPAPRRNASAAGDASPVARLRLFQPRKLGNLDCTFCLDCVHSCPHTNVGISDDPYAGQRGSHRQGRGEAAPSSECGHAGPSLLRGHRSEHAVTIPCYAEQRSGGGPLVGRRFSP